MKDEWTYKLSSEELKRKNYSFNDSELKTYIEKFDNDLLIHSQDECGGSLQFWYDPLKTFVTFFAP